MKIVFDSGVLITFSESCFMSLFRSLKEKLGDFIITKSVHYECIGKVEHIMRFKLSALRIEDVIDTQIFEVYEGSQKLDKATKEIMDLTNNMFYIRGKPLKIIQIGEAESLALLGLTEANYLAVDERTTRMLVEQPHGLIHIFKRKYKTGNIKFDENKYLRFKELIGNVNAIRSVDLFAYAQKQKLLTDKFDDSGNVKAAMFAMKFKGCSVSFEEINEYVSEL